MPTPLVSILNGGVLSANDLPLRDIQLCPTGVKTFEEAIRYATRLQNVLKEAAPEPMNRTQAGGGFAAFWIDEVDDALAFVHRIVSIVNENAGSKDRRGLQLAVDVAASAFFQEADESDGARGGHAHYDLGYKLCASPTLETNNNNDGSGAKDENEDEEDSVEMEGDTSDGTGSSATRRQSEEEFLETCAAWIRKYDIKMITDPFANTTAAMPFWSALKRGQIGSEEGDGTVRKPLDIVVAARSLLRTSTRTIPEALREGRYDVAHFNFYEHVTVSDGLRAAFDVHAAGLGIALDIPAGGDRDGFLGDFAVAADCESIVIPGLHGTPQLRKVERLLEIERILRSAGKGGAKVNYAGAALRNSGRRR
eukprot:g629.t1